MPRLLIGETHDGHVLCFRSDVPDATVHEIAALDPSDVQAIAERLSMKAEASQANSGVIWVFPDELLPQVEAEIVSSGTTGSDVLLSRLGREGMPWELAELGFSKPEDLWRPWCAVIDEGTIASIAFTVGFTLRSAEAGVATIASKRGRGFAAAAVAAWSRHRDFWGATMFYGADAGNLSSHRVAQRLGLRRIATVTAFS